MATALRLPFRATLPARLRLLRGLSLLMAAALGLLLVVTGLTLSGTWDAVAERQAPAPSAPRA